MDIRDRVLLTAVYTAQKSGRPTYVRELQSNPTVRSEMSTKGVSQRVTRFKDEGILTAEPCDDRDIPHHWRVQYLNLNRGLLPELITMINDLSEADKERFLTSIERIADSMEHMAGRRSFADKRETKTIKAESKE